MQKAQEYYNEARFEEALEACYSAEIEANLLIVKAEEAMDIQKKIAYYKEALIAISKFSDKEVLVEEQNRLQLILSELYKPIDQEVSNIYQEKAEPQTTKEKNYLPWILIPLLLFIWAFWDFLKKLGNFFRNLV